MKDRLQSRRLVPRFATLGEIQVFLDGARVYLLDLSAGGFAVQSRAPFEEAKTYTFRLHPAQDADLLLRGVAMHCLHTTEVDEEWYVAGFAFAADTTDAEREHVSALIRGVVKGRVGNQAADATLVVS
jgi:hypothetical protein